MNTTEAMKQAMQALRDAGIPEDLWPTALPLALADVRASEGSAAAAAVVGTHSAKVKTAKKSAPKKAAPKPSLSSETPTALAELGDEKTLFGKIESETDVAVSDLGDLFHMQVGNNTRGFEKILEHTGTG